MRIFYASGRTPNNTRLPGSQLWQINMLDTLVQMGVDVVQPTYDVEEQYRNCRPKHECPKLQKRRARYSQMFVDDVTRAHNEKPLDLVFTYFYDRHIDVGAVEEVKALGVPTVNFFCNDVHQFHLVERIAPHFDYNMAPARDALASYEKAGAKVIHEEMAANPRFYKPCDAPVEYDVTFVGQRYLNREPWMAHLQANGVECHAFGPRWDENPHSIGKRLSDWFHTLTGRKRSNRATDDSLLPLDHRHGPLSDDDMIAMYSRSRINLNFSEVRMPDGSIGRHVRLRDFEVPMSGGLYFTGTQDELSEYYEIDKEIICFDTKEELLDKARYYLAHEDEADAVRRAGRERALRDHTWEKRFEKLFAEIGLQL